MRAASPKSARLVASSCSEASLRLDGGQLLFSRADLTRPPFVLAAGAGKLRFSRGVLEPDRLERLLCAVQRLDRNRAIRDHALLLTPQIVFLDVELAERLAHPLVLHRRVLEHMTDGHDRVERHVDALTRGLDMGVEALDLLLRRGMRGVGGAHHRRGLVARTLGIGLRGRRDSIAIRAGSRRASRSRISASISVPRPASVSA